MRSLLLWLVLLPIPLFANPFTGSFPRANCLRLLAAAANDWTDDAEKVREAVRLLQDFRLRSLEHVRPKNPRHVPARANYYSWDDFHENAADRIRGIELEILQKRMAVQQTTVLVLDGRDAINGYADRVKAMRANLFPLSAGAASALRAIFTAAFTYTFVVNGMRTDVGFPETMQMLLLVGLGTETGMAYLDEFDFGFRSTTAQTRVPQRHTDDWYYDGETVGLGKPEVELATGSPLGALLAIAASDRRSDWRTLPVMRWFMPRHPKSTMWVAWDRLYYWDAEKQTPRLVLLFRAYRWEPTYQFGAEPVPDADKAGATVPQLTF